MTNEIGNPRLPEDVVKACDFVGLEPYFDLFTQGVVWHRRDMGGYWQKNHDTVLTLAQADAEAKCRRPVAGGKTKPVQFTDAKFHKLIKTTRDIRFKARWVNITKEIVEKHWPAHACTESDWAEGRKFFLEHWGAHVADQDEADLIMHMTEQHIVNLFDRAFDPGAMVRAQLGLFGEGEGGKTDYAESLLHQEARELGLYMGPMDLRKDPENLIKEQAGYWLAEYAELTNIHGADIDKVKAFLTSTERGAREPVRGPADAVQDDLPRRGHCQHREAEAVP